MEDINLLGKPEKGKKQKGILAKKSPDLLLTNPPKESHHDPLKEQRSGSLSGALNKWFGPKPSVDTTEKKHEEKFSPSPFTMQKKNPKTVSTPSPVTNGKIPDPTSHISLFPHGDKGNEKPLPVDTRVFTPHRSFFSGKKSDQVLEKAKPVSKGTPSVSIKKKPGFFSNFFSGFSAEKKKVSSHESSVVPKREEAPVAHESVASVPVKDVSKKFFVPFENANREIKKLHTEESVQPSFASTPTQRKPDTSAFGGRAKRRSRDSGDGMGGGIDVNLMPGGLVIEPTRRMRTLINVAVATFVLVILAYVGLTGYDFFLHNSSLQVESDIAAIEKEMLQYKDVQQQATKTKKHLDALQGVLKQHVYWSRFLSYLEKYTLSEVYYMEMSGDTGGRISLIGVTDNYRTVGQQLLTLENAHDFVKQVAVREGSVKEEQQTATVEAGTSEQPKIIFTIDLTVRPEVFLFDTMTKISDASLTR